MRAEPERIQLAYHALDTYGSLQLVTPTKDPFLAASTSISNFENEFKRWQAAPSKTQRRTAYRRLQLIVPMPPSHPGLGKSTGGWGGSHAPTADGLQITAQDASGVEADSDSERHEVWAKQIHEGLQQMKDLKQSWNCGNTNAPTSASQFQTGQVALQRGHERRPAQQQAGVMLDSIKANDATSKPLTSLFAASAAPGNVQAVAGRSLPPHNPDSVARSRGRSKTKSKSVNGHPPGGQIHGASGSSKRVDANSGDTVVIYNDDGTMYGAKCAYGNVQQTDQSGQAPVVSTGNACAASIVQTAQSLIQQVHSLPQDIRAEHRDEVQQTAKKLTFMLSQSNLLGGAQRPAAISNFYDLRSDPPYKHEAWQVLQGMHMKIQGIQLNGDTTQAMSDRCVCCLMLSDPTLAHNVLRTVCTLIVVRKIDCITGLVVEQRRHSTSS
jgi:hypothetical protein